MSVIMAYKAKDKLYLGADNRVCTQEDIPVRDDINKIIAVNNNVAVAFAGYYKNQIIFEMVTSKFRNDTKYRVENALCSLKIIYWYYRVHRNQKYAKDALSVNSSFIVAGKNKKGEHCIYAVSYINGKLEKPTLTDMILFPPSDISEKVCYDAYIKNTNYYYSDFVQATVKDIAKVSKIVSPSGDIWTYDFATNISDMKHFC